MANDVDLIDVQRVDGVGDDGEDRVVVCVELARR
jgi:hypothetical protein